MSQNSDNCGCDGYALLTANTSVELISNANPSLTGSSSTLIFTAGGSGSTIKSVTIKAAMPVTAGMIRLYIADSSATTYSLYKEIPVPTSPALAATPTPAPMLQTFEIKLDGGLKLNSGYRLYASTQNAEKFNVIAEGIDWAYPAETPTVCCNFKQTLATTGVVTASAANTNLDGSGTITQAFVAPAGGSNGSLIKTITIKALQSTNEGIVRLFIKQGGTYFLMKEILIPQTTQSGFQPSYKVVLDDCFYINAGGVIGVSTQIAQSFAITVEGESWSYAS